MGISRTMPFSLRARGAAVAVLSCAAGVPPCMAQSVAQSSYLVSGGVGYTDNISRTDTNEQSETIATAGVNLDLDKRTRRLTAQLEMDTTYLEYLDDTYDSEVVGTAVAGLNFAILPGRLDWRLDDTFGQTSADRLAADTPENRSYINVLSTGPTWTVRLGAADRLQLSADYGRSDSEQSDFDNERIGGRLSWIHSPSEASSYYLRGRHEAVTFSGQAGDADYDRLEGTVGYQFDGARTQWSLEGGYVQIERDDGREETGTTARISVRRQLSPASIVQLIVGRQLADASEMLVSEQRIAPTDGTFPIVESNEPVTNSYGQLRWSFFRSRTGASIDAMIVEDRYDVRTDLDRDRQEYDARIWRTLSSRTAAQLVASYRKEEFTASSLGYDEYLGAVRFNVTLGAVLFGALEYQHVRREADSSSVVEYSDNLIWLRLFYGRSRRPEDQFLGF